MGFLTNALHSLHTKCAPSQTKKKKKKTAECEINSICWSLSRQCKCCCAPQTIERAARSQHSVQKTQPYQNCVHCIFSSRRAEKASRRASVFCFVLAMRDLNALPRGTLWSSLIEYPLAMAPLWTHLTSAAGRRLSRSVSTAATSARSSYRPASARPRGPIRVALCSVLYLCLHTSNSLISFLMEKRGWGGIHANATRSEERGTKERKGEKKGGGEREGKGRK